MSDPEKTPEPERTGRAKEEAVRHTPVQRADPARRRPGKIVDAGTAGARRDFFSEAMREALVPLSGILERKITPILAALEALPDDAERLANGLPLAAERAVHALDQPQILGPRHAPRRLPLGQAGDNEPVRFLRPPGAVPGQFESLCSGCNKCVEVCPAHAIQVDKSSTLIGNGFPYIDPRSQPCVVCTSLACMTECPTGALRVLDRLQIRMGTAKVSLDLCRREDGEDCRLCVEACPITGEGAGGGTAGGEAMFIHEQSGRIRIRRNACIGCGLCESRCPTEPAAITIEPFRVPVDPIIA